MFVFPCHLTFRKSLTVCRWWWRVRDFGDEVCSRCLRNPIHQNPDEWDLDKHGKGECESKKDTFTVHEPFSFLLFVKANATKIGLELQQA